MKILQGNYLAFFALQAITWFALIGSVYLLSKELKVKHLFITPFLIIFSTTMFVDNYVGSFENDYMAIVLFITGMTFWYKKDSFLNKVIAIFLFVLGTSTWFWFGYVKGPIFLSPIAEEMWWVQIMTWGLLTIPFLAGTWVALENVFIKKENKFISLTHLFAFCFSRLWFFAIPSMIKFVDKWIQKISSRPNYKFYMSIIIFALILGQGLRVGLLTYTSWNYGQDSNCYTVNHEYLARIQGKSLNYNQASIHEYNKCIEKELVNKNAT